MAAAVDSYYRFVFMSIRMVRRYPKLCVGVGFVIDGVWNTGWLGGSTDVLGWGGGSLVYALMSVRGFPFAQDMFSVLH
jgi:hypothetical protein